MPGSQFDELRLQVSLVDNATAQLKSIKSSLDELGTGSQANNLDRLKRETSEVDAALRKMVDTALRGPKAFLDLATDTISKFNTIKDHADAIFEQFKGRGQEQLGKRIRDRILDEFKIPGALNVTESIKPVTDAMSAHLKRQIASAKEYEEVTIR